MTAGFFGRVPHVALLLGLVLLATATLTFAATSTTPPAATPPVVTPASPEPLVVPDVRGQAYVFAKGALEEAGFAWRVTGPVQGFPANRVAGQSPAPGAKVVGNGAPIIVLRLERNGSYEQEGVPENVSPFEGAPARLAGVKRLERVPTRTQPPRQQPARPKARRNTGPKTALQPAASRRPPAFVVTGAPREPLDEITLAARAKRLAAWVEAHPKRTRANVRHWLYQHTWIVTGARFGWSHGAEALRTLIAVDERVQKRWGIGGRSEQVARRALAFVQQRSR